MTGVETALLAWLWLGDATPSTIEEAESSSGHLSAYMETQRVAKIEKKKKKRGGKRGSGGCLSSAASSIADKQDELDDLIGWFNKVNIFICNSYVIHM